MGNLDEIPFSSMRSSMSHFDSGGDGPPKIYEELIQNLEADIRKHIRVNITSITFLDWIVVEAPHWKYRKQNRRTRNNEWKTWNRESTNQRRQN